MKAALERAAVKDKSTPERQSETAGRLATVERSLKDANEFAISREWSDVVARWNRRFATH